MKKLFIIRKYVEANSITDAVKKEKHIAPEDIFLDEDWKRVNIEKIEVRKIGFNNKKNA